MMDQEFGCSRAYQEMSKDLLFFYRLLLYLFFCKSSEVSLSELLQPSSVELSGNLFVTIKYFVIWKRLKYHTV